MSYRFHCFLFALSLSTALSASGCDSDSDDDNGKDPKGDGEEVIETNLQPALCKEDNDCGGDIKCGKNGYCEVSEMKADAGASLGAPAPCENNDDCGGAQCVAREGGAKFCDVPEMTVGSGPSLGAPALCESDKDCGDAKCVQREGGKFCDVQEMIAP